MESMNHKSQEQNITDFQAKQIELQQKLKDHMKTVRERGDDWRAECWQLFISWPRGNGAGELLAVPEVDDTPVENRGLSGKWTEAVSLRMEQTNWSNHITREVVEHFIKPLTKIFTCPLYYFIPKTFRNTPTAFISHSWDGYLSDVMVCDDLRSFFWLDIIAINQHDYSSEISKIGEIVESCGETKLILPGSGDKALRPIYRSWCIFEIVHTKEENFYPSVSHIHMNYAFHHKMVKEIKSLSVENAQAWFPSDKKIIDDLVLRKFGTYAEADKLVKERIKKTFYDTYRRKAETESVWKKQFFECSNFYKA